MKKDNTTDTKFISRSAHFYRIGKYVIWCTSNKHPHEKFSREKFNTQIVKTGDPITEEEWLDIRKASLPLVWVAILENGETFTEEKINGMLALAAEKHIDSLRSHKEVTWDKV